MWKLTDYWPMILDKTARYSNKLAIEVSGQGRVCKDRRTHSLQVLNNWGKKKIQNDM